MGVLFVYILKTKFKDLKGKQPISGYSLYEEGTKYMKCKIFFSCSIR
jgi:hypothetical protein